MSGEESEKSTIIGQKSRVSMLLAGSIALGGIYLGKVEMRVEALEADRTEIRSDVKEVLRKVDDIRVHIASMDRRNGTIDQASAEVKRDPRGN